MKNLFILIIVSFAMLMEAIDTTIINTAIPSMAQSLNLNPVDLKLALISYLLSLAIFIPISGWLADKFGHKRIFILALMIFTLSSIGCGFTSTLWQLIIMRFIQGLGGSLTMPVGRLIIIRLCERHELVSKMSVVVMIAALGMMLGPVLGGIITTHFTWPWVFWVNVPFGTLAIILAYFLFPSMPSIEVPPLDLYGFILFGSGLATLTYSLSAFSESSLSSLHALTALGIAMLFLYGYQYHSKRQANPIVKTHLLRKRTFRISVFGNLFARLGFGGVPFLLPLLLQIGLKFSPQLSGLLLAPTALGVLLVKPFSVYLLRFLGYKKLLLTNTILIALLLWLFTTINAQTSLLSISFLTFVYGFFISLQYTGMNSLAYANIEEEELSAATSIMSTVQQLAQSFGVAFAAILLHLFLPLHFIPFLFIESLHHAFFFLGIITLCSASMFLSLRPNDGQELIHKSF